MPRKIKVSELLEFDMSRFLEDEEDIAAYLNDVIAEDDPSLFSAALGDIARARGMTEIARVSGISREALYRALSSSSQPRFETISRVCAALGVKLVAVPAHT